MKVYNPESRQPTTYNDVGILSSAHNMLFTAYCILQTAHTAHVRILPITMNERSIGAEMEFDVSRAETRRKRNYE